MVLMCEHCRKPCAVKRIDNSWDTETSFEYCSDCCLEEIIDLSVSDDPEDYHEEMLSQKRLEDLWGREKENLMKWDDYEGENE